MNVVDWSEIDASITATIKLAVGKVKQNKGKVWYYLSAEDFGILDQAVTDLECTCKEDVPEEQKRVLRISLNLAVKMEISSKEEYKDIQVKSKLKIKMKGKAGLKDDLKKVEAKAALRAAMSFEAEGSGANEAMYSVSNPMTKSSRRLCAEGRCLADEDVEITVNTAVQGFERVGDQDESVQMDMEGADVEKLTKRVQDNLIKVGLTEAAAGIEITELTPESAECETGCRVEARAELVAGGEGSIPTESNVGGAPRAMMSSAILMTLSVLLVFN